MAKPGDKANIPWSVKGVSKEARQLAKKAAAAEGMTMGAWLSRAIRADGQAPMATPVHDDNSIAPSPDTMPPALLEPTDSIPSEPGPSEPGPSNPDLSDENARRRIIERVAESEDRILGVVQPLHEIILQITGRIEALEQRARGVASQALPRPKQNTTSIYRKTGWD